MKESKEFLIDSNGILILTGFNSISIDSNGIIIRFQLILKGILIRFLLILTGL